MDTKSFLGPRARVRAAASRARWPQGAFDSRSLQAPGPWAGGAVPAAAAAEIMLLILFYREQPSLLCTVQNVLFCELSLNFSNPLCLRNHTDTEGKRRGR